MYDEFIRLLDKVKYSPETDYLILLGDYVDRGPEPIKVIQKVMELVADGAKALMGNHERMFLWAHEDPENEEYISLHCYNGGQVTWEKFKEVESREQIRIIEFIKRLPITFVVDNYLFVHAGIHPAHGYEQDENDLLWIRNDFLYYPTNIKEIVVYGHTPMARICNSGDKIGIDCGCVYGGKLACLELPSEKEYYVEATKQ